MNDNQSRVAAAFAALDTRTFVCPAVPRTSTVKHRRQTAARSRRRCDSEERRHCFSFMISILLQRLSVGTVRLSPPRPCVVAIPLSLLEEVPLTPHSAKADGIFSRYGNFATASLPTWDQYYLQSHLMDFPAFSLTLHCLLSLSYLASPRR